ncbi:hypothetical protein MB84_00490 [Pandoraea oxalativorans]|uniref:Uncharacterized protein n=1 Tax=Pandoraea oxalativorans TaxID=573737 RepID=A0A0E3U4G1_9BURK|nr:hypothetical protein MB84_00490 [Pandoraea oxalativorans]
MTACPDCADATPGMAASVVSTVAVATISGKVCLFMFVSLIQRCTAMFGILPCSPCRFDLLFCQMVCGNA